MKHARLPAAPLRRVLLRLRDAESLTWDELADRAGLSSRHLFRLLAARTVSELVADRISCRIGLHPALLWPKEWFRQENPRRLGSSNAGRILAVPTTKEVHMKLTLSAKPLAADLKAVLPAVATRSGLPILSGVRLEVSNDGLAIEATDLEVTARRVVQGSVAVEDPGSVVVPAKALAEAVAAMAEPQIALESAPNNGRADLAVRAGTRTVTLQGWPIEDWPASPPATATDPIASVDAPELADALARVALCASNDDARPVLTGVVWCLQEDPPALELVATDSYRLGAVRIALSSPPRVPESPLLVPARACRILAKQLKGVRGPVEIRTLETRGEERLHAELVGFSVPEATWTVRTINGEFPNWRQVVPEAGGGLFEFDPSELTSALRAASAVHHTKGAPVRLTLDGNCSISVREQDLGEMREALRGASFSPNGEGSVEIAFNPDYLADAIAFCGVERGRMWVRDALKPALLEGPDRRCALMPVRIP